MNPTPNAPVPFRHLPFLDGLRAVSILVVLTWHSHGPLRTLGARLSGWSGVDVFFVVSGFLITALLLKEQAETGTVSFRGFYLRRALRIMPAYYVFLAAILLFYGPGASEAVGIAALYLSNYDAALGDRLTNTVPLGHTWSLAIEEQFYLLWPLTLWLAGRRALVVTLTTIGAVIAWKLWHIRGGSPEHLLWFRLYYAFDTRADSLLIGCAAALLWMQPAVRAAVTSGLAGRWTAALPVIALLYSMQYMAAAGRGQHFWCVLVPMHSVLVALLIWAMLAVPTGPVAATLSHPAATWLGRRSYSLYLWQMPLMDLGFAAAVALLPAGPWVGWAADAAGIGLSLAAAELSYRLVEQPFLRLKDAWGRRPAPQPATTAAAPATTT